MGDAEIGFMDTRFLTTLHVEEDVTEIIVVGFVVFFNLYGFNVTLVPGGKVALTDAAP